MLCVFLCVFSSQAAANPTRSACALRLWQTNSTAINLHILLHGWRKQQLKFTFTTFAQSNDVFMFVVFGVLCMHVIMSIEYHATYVFAIPYKKNRTFWVYRSLNDSKILSWSMLSHPKWSSTRNSSNSQSYQQQKA